MDKIKLVCFDVDGTLVDGIAVHCFNKDLEKVAWKTVDSLKQIKKIL